MPEPKPEPKLNKAEVATEQRERDLAAPIARAERLAPAIDELRSAFERIEKGYLDELVDIPPQEHERVLELTRLLRCSRQYRLHCEQVMAMGADAVRERDQIRGSRVWAKIQAWRSSRR